jgi:translation initiation factor IF-3
VDIKEVQLRPAIDTHDLDIKVNKIKEWIADGDKVKVVIRFRGREMANQSVGFKLIEHIIATVPSAKVEGRSEIQGNRLTAIISQAK